MRFAAAFLVAALMAATVQAMPGLVGACKTKNYTTVDLDVKRYVGHWYEISHSESFYFDGGCFCTTADYSMNADGTVNVYNSCAKDSPTGTVSGKNATARQPDPSQPGHLLVNFGIPFADGNYDVIMIGEEYEYSVVVSCDWLPIVGGSNIWILSRTPTVDPILLATIKAKTADMGFVLDDLVDTVQAGCLPRKEDFSAIAPVVTPAAPELAASPLGQCTFPNNNITNFSLDKYLGTWYLIYNQADFFEDLFTHDCVCSTTTLNPSNGTIEASQDCRLKTPTGQPANAQAQFVEISPEYSAQGVFEQYFKTPIGTSVTEHYTIMDITDDYEYALVSNCVDLVVSRSFCMYFLSRSPAMPLDIFMRFKTFASANNLLNDKLKQIQQDGCWSF